MFGFAVLLVMGVAYHALPRLSGVALGLAALVVFTSAVISTARPARAA